jgi:group I intron endonuclease
MNCGIYLITNTTNGMKYVGQSRRLATRWSIHKADFHRCRSSRLCRAVLAHGEQAFKFEVLEHCTPEQLDEREAFFIAWFETTNRAKGYNVRGGGSSARLSAASRKGAARMAEMWKDPEIRARWLVRRREAALLREANIRARRMADPVYAAQDHARRSVAAKKNPGGGQQAAAKSFKNHMRADPEFAARVRANRSAAGKVSAAKKWGVICLTG